MHAAFPLSSAPLELQAGLNDQRGRAMKLKAGGGIEDGRVHAAAADAAAGGDIRGLIAPRPPVLAARQTPTGPAPTQGPPRDPLPCLRCRRGALLARCPTCCGGDWRLALAGVTAGEDEMAR